MVLFQILETSALETPRAGPSDSRIKERRFWLARGISVSCPCASRIRPILQPKRMAIKNAHVQMDTQPEAKDASSPGHASANPSLKPEDQELARKREEQSTLEAELADRELRVANLAAELSAFERQYLHYVGSRYAELDELKAQIAERLAKEQPANERAQQAAREARARAGETKSAAGEKSAEAPRAFHATPEMKRLYRDVAKRIHPDLTSDRDDRSKRQILMAEANEAYQKGDDARLTKILHEYECSPESVQGEGPGAELIRVIRRISQARGRLAEIEAEMQEILRSDLHQLKSRVDEAQKNGRDVLKEMVAKVEDQVSQARQRLEHPKRPESSPHAE
jgi:hypothetical protein